MTKPSNLSKILKSYLYRICFLSLYLDNTREKYTLFMFFTTLGIEQFVHASVLRVILRGSKIRM